MNVDARYRPVFWIGSALDDLWEFPDNVKRVLGFAVHQAQRGGKHVSAKPMKGFGGAGVLEAADDYCGNTYRAVYTLKLADAVYVLHAFQKKSTRGISTPKHDIELVRERLRRAEEHYREWCKERKCAP